MRTTKIGFAARLATFPAVAALTLGGCANFAPSRLHQDQIGYSESLGDSQKAQTLLNVVRLRYGDFPVFLKTTQIISGYSLQQNLGGTIYPGSGLSPAIATPGVSVGQTPTFTFQPVSGDALAQSFVRPLSPTELLPLTMSGLPIDVLFRLAVQSVNGRQNTTALDKSDRSGASGFARLLVNLRALQKADLVGVRLDRKAGVADANSAGRLMLLIADGGEPSLRAIAAETRDLLGMRPGVTEAEVVYGRGPAGSGRITILTRSILGVLSYVGSEIVVAREDVARGSTLGAASYAGVLRRPAVIVRSGGEAPADSFSKVLYRDRWYWIDSDDFDSKVAFSVVQMLMTLAETTQPSGTVVTIPAR